ncbi:hypothetical protein N7488_004351 [Penicillium malachiteum]|nr:hypothetical protein N7488_004351 [Penicillium malachiteum]
MATYASYNGVNSGIQVVKNYGPITANLGQPERLLDQACLRDLRTTNPCDDKERIKKTNGGLLKDSYRWILENAAFRKWQTNESNRLLWIRGDPGKGKTMLLCGIIEELTELHGDTATISFFFCQATDMRINSATSVLRGLIYLLVEKHPSLLRHVRARYDSAGKDLLVFEKYFVIDALDECRDGLKDLLDLIVEHSTTHQEIRWAVSSRNEFEITECLGSATYVAPISLELNEASVSVAVAAFIQHKVDDLAKRKIYNAKTTTTIKRHLLTNSQGTFLWVALVWKNLDQTPRRHVMKKLGMFPPGLDAFYRRMMGQVRNSEDAELCKQILGTVTAVYRPVTLSELSSLLAGRNDGFNDLDTLLESAKDFLTREVFTEMFPKGLDSEHYTIFSQYLDVLFKKLRRDILNLKLPGIFTKDISVPSPNPLAPAEYACIHWVDHLGACKDSVTYRFSLKNKETLDTFLQQKYLHWLEALSILGSLSDGIRAIKRLEGLISEERSSDNTVWIWDPATGQSVATLKGHSDLVRSITWSPDGSQLASGSIDKTVRIWDPTTGQSVATLKGHSDLVRSITWSPDGSQLASGSIDKTVRIWDPTTGQSVSTLKGYSDSVRSITWSLDGSQLASGSIDKTVWIWDPATGQSVATLKGHSDSVDSIAWSLDGSQLASGSYDETVRIWDPATGQSMSTLSTGFTSFVKFDIADSNFLHTDAGTFCISSVDAVTPMHNTFPHPAKQCGYGLRGDRSWITYCGLNLLWLPSEYRPLSVSLFSIREAKMAFVCSSNRVIFLALSNHCPIPTL